MIHCYLRIIFKSTDYLKIKKAIRSIYSSSTRDALLSARKTPEFIENKLAADRTLRTALVAIVGLFMMPLLLWNLRGYRRIVFFYDSRVTNLSGLGPDYPTVEIKDGFSLKILKSGNAVSTSSIQFWAPVSGCFGKTVKFPLVITIFFFLCFLKNRKVILVTYSDNIRIAEFFLILNKLEEKKVQVVNVQHGYWVKYNNFLMRERYEGHKSQHEIIIDETQGNQFRKKNHYVLGTQFNASAKVEITRNIIFVGVGDSGRLHDGMDWLDRSREIYTKLAKELMIRKNVRIYYRPHPSEKIPASKFFKENLSVLLENSSKTKLLNAGRSIFVGFGSTLLFEAGVAGHIVVDISPPNKLFTTTFRKHCYLSYESPILEKCYSILSLVDRDPALLYPAQKEFYLRLFGARNFICNIIGRDSL